ncbi:hypothetical protein [Bradyrhizobium sp. SZCCHNR3118]|uniref:hypothetical protein n=1 Tax=Bradyrhizobium sp. SZCCHNR3118 TaxID=3057468 RepID=UPI00291649C4|nr:hypothetical protein [Bradyrhizobium sp. SZCCHNR3118]
MTAEVTMTITNLRIIVAGPVSFVATKIEEPGKKPQLKFRMICGDEVLADMGEEAARFFIKQAQETFIGEYDDEWLRMSTVHAAVDADRQRVAAQNAT